jgi:hypothetical protein
MIPASEVTLADKVQGSLLTLEQCKAIASEYSMRATFEGFKVEVNSAPWLGDGVAALHASLPITNVETLEPDALTWSEAFTPARLNELEFRRKIAAAARSAILHELDECFFVKDHNVRDPHPERKRVPWENNTFSLPLEVKAKPVLLLWVAVRTRVAKVIRTALLKVGDWLLDCASSSTLN